MPRFLGKMPRFPVRVESASTRRADQGISMFESSMSIEGFDDELFASIGEEERRQEEHIELIASENYASPRVMQAQGSVLTNK